MMRLLKADWAAEMKKAPPIVTKTVLREEEEVRQEMQYDGNGWELGGRGRTYNSQSH